MLLTQIQTRTVRSSYSVFCNLAFTREEAGLAHTCKLPCISPSLTQVMTPTVLHRYVMLKLANTVMPPTVTQIRDAQVSKYCASAACG